MNIPFSQSGVTRLIMGFKNIEFPKDICIDSSCNIFVIGLRKSHFSKCIQDAFSDNNIKINFYVNFDPLIAQLRQKALERESDSHSYLDNNISYFSSFIKEYSEAQNNSFWEYSIMPIGLFAEFGNYLYFTPMWVKSNAGSAIHQWTFEVQRQSPFGTHLLSQFEYIQNTSKKISKF